MLTFFEILSIILYKFRKEYIMKLICIDTETTGVDVSKHGICTLAAIVYIGGKEVDCLELKLNPRTYNRPVEINPQALEVNGLTEAELDSYSPSATAFCDFITFLEKYINRYDKSDKFEVMGYNSQFDTAFIRAWFLDNNHYYYGSYFKNYDLDVFALVKWVNFMDSGFGVGLSNLKLTTVCEKLGIELKGAHTALADIRATVQLKDKLFSSYVKIPGL